jgi:ABC-type branched-subunit amino acid transport system substrate-binding protein
MAVVLGLNLTSTRKGSFRESLQGAYLAQVAYNQLAPQRNSPSLVVIVANNGASPANTNWVAQQILALKKGNSHIVGVVGWPGSKDSINANRVLAHQPNENENVFMLSPTAVSSDLGGSPHFLRIVLRELDQADYMAKYIYDRLNYRSVAIIYTSEDNYAVNLYKAFKDAFTQKNATKIVSEQPFSEGDKASLQTALSHALERRSRNQPLEIYLKYIKWISEMEKDLLLLLQGNTPL